LQAADRIGLFGAISRSFRYPVLDELFDFFSNTILANLEPQASTDVQAGIRIERGRVQASAGVFRVSTDDEIFFNPVGGSGFGANENLAGRTRRTGIEASVSALVGPATVSGTVALLDADIEGGPYDGQGIPSVAARRATVRLRAPLPAGVSVGIDGAYVGPRRFEGDFADQFGRQDGYVLVDLKVAHERERTRVFVDLKNLFDCDYSEFGVLGGFPRQRAFYPSPGIHALAGVDLAF
jgi:iron complex outermembrane receptor protein